MLCMFDLPVELDEEKRAYRIFRKNLLREGFTMIQYSVYVRTCPNRDFASRLTNKVKSFAPPKGNVRLIMITEKQYDEMIMIVGSKNLIEEKIGSERMIIL